MEWLIVLGIVIFLVYVVFKWLFTTPWGWFTIGVLLSPLWAPLLWIVLKKTAAGLHVVAQYVGRLIGLAVIVPSQAVASWFKSPVSTCPACYRTAHHSYVCPHCLRVEPVAPSLEHGALSWTCKCWQPLPTLDLMGRDRLRSSCVDCGARFDTLRGRERHVGFVAMPGADKTSVALTAIRTLEQRGYALTKDTPAELRDAVGRANSNGAGVYNSGRVPRAIRLSQGKGRKNTLYLYDPDDETYLSQFDTMQLAFLENVSGLVCVLDPEQRNRSKSAKSERTQLNEDVYGRLLASLTSHAGNAAARNVRMAVVVITDNPPHGGTKMRPEAAQAWLEGQSYGPLLRLITHDFKRVRFFFAVPATTEWPEQTAAAVTWAAG